MAELYTSRSTTSCSGGSPNELGYVPGVDHPESLSYLYHSQCHTTSIPDTLIAIDVKHSIMASQTNKTDGSSVVATQDQLGSRSRDVAWYSKDISEIPEAAREVLEKYSKVPAENVKDHVTKVVSSEQSLLVDNIH